MTEIAATEFLSAFQLRRACYRALLDLSRRQAALIDRDDYPELLGVLQSKQALVDHLHQMSESQTPLRTAWPLCREAMPAAARDQCETVLADTESLLAELLTEEQASSSRLILRRDAAQRELQAVSAGVRAQAAYHSRPDPVLSRFDFNT